LPQGRGRLGDQRLQTLLGGRITLVIELVQLERLHHGGDVLLGGDDARIVGAPISFGTTNAARMPMITTTTMISISVKRALLALSADGGVRSGNVAHKIQPRNIDDGPRV